jgi:cobalt-zinc-cadmium efflux system protein
MGHHGHSHALGHAHGHPDLGRILKISTLATLAFVLLALAAGYYAHSLALISDAWHNFSDALALVLSWLAVWLQTRPPDAVKTFGYHRAGVLAAFVNAVTLVGVALYLFYESYHRLLEPQKVNEGVMIVVSIAGLALNVAIAWALHQSSRKDLNIRSAFLHLVGDALGSVAVLAGAVAIRFTGVQAIDPILSIAIGVLILWSSWDIIKESLNVLLEGLPRNMTLEQVIAALRGVPGVLDVHDLHVWTLGPHMLALSCHIRIADIPPSESEQILRSVNQCLCDRFEIRHTTIQFEHEMCAEPCAVGNHSR